MQTSTSSLPSASHARDEDFSVRIRLIHCDPSSLNIVPAREEYFKPVVFASPVVARDDWKLCYRDVHDLYHDSYPEPDAGADADAALGNSDKVVTDVSIDVNESSMAPCVSRTRQSNPVHLAARYVAHFSPVSLPLRLHNHADRLACFRPLPSLHLQAFNFAEYKLETSRLPSFLLFLAGHTDPFTSRNGPVVHLLVTMAGVAFVNPVIYHLYHLPETFSRSLLSVRSISRYATFVSLRPCALPRVSAASFYPSQTSLHASNFHQALAHRPTHPLFHVVAYVYSATVRKWHFR